MYNKTKVRTTKILLDWVLSFTRLSKTNKCSPTFRQDTARPSLLFASPEESACGCLAGSYPRRTSVKTTLWVLIFTSMFVFTTWQSSLTSGKVSTDIDKHVSRLRNWFPVVAGHYRAKSVVGTSYLKCSASLAAFHDLFQSVKYNFETNFFVSKVKIICYARIRVSNFDITFFAL